MVELLVWVGAISLIVLLALRSLLRTERYGLSDKQFREYSRSGGRLGNAFLAVQALFEPDKQHVVEARRSELAEDVESGAPPRQGGE